MPLPFLLLIAKGGAGMERIFETLFYDIIIDNIVSLAVFVIVLFLMSGEDGAGLFRSMYAASCFATAYNLFARRYYLHR
jgi:hypothetical protein